MFHWYASVFRILFERLSVYRLISLRKICRISPQTAVRGLIPAYLNSLFKAVAKLPHAPSRIDQEICVRFYSEILYKVTVTIVHESGEDIGCMIFGIV